MAAPPDGSEVYRTVQQFYAGQALLLDAGLHDPAMLRKWSGTFTENGTFWISFLPEPAVGRESIVDAILRSTEHVRRTGTIRRHWFAMLDLLSATADVVRTRYYALVLATGPDGLGIDACTVTEDTLVHTADGLRTLAREIRRDDQPVSPAAG
jgi:hypothetical protein